MADGKDRTSSSSPQRREFQQCNHDTSLSGEEPRVGEVVETQTALSVSPNQYRLIVDIDSFPNPFNSFYYYNNIATLSFVLSLCHATPSDLDPVDLLKLQACSI